MATNCMTVEREFEKNKNLTKRDLETLREWMSRQPHLPRISDLDLIIFFHSCHWSTELTKQTIDIYYTIRTHVPEFFAHRDPNHITLTNVMKVFNCCVLPNAGPEGQTIFYGNLKNRDYNVFNFNELLKYFIHITDLMLQQQGTFHSFLIVVDVEGVTLGHVTKLGIMSMKKFLTYLQDALPVRLAGIHFIHPVPVMDKILALMKPFLKPELSQSLLIHMSMDAFYKHVIKDKLPKELGGQNSTIAQLDKETREKILINKNYYIQEEKQRVDETMRPGKPKNAGDLFGVEGSFKKLDID